MSIRHVRLLAYVVLWGWFTSMIEMVNAGEYAQAAFIFASPFILLGLERVWRSLRGRRGDA